MAEDELRILPQYYNIISDEKDDSVDKETYLLEGKIQMFSSLSPIENVLVGCTSSGTWTKSDQEGNFSIRLKNTDQRVYFYLKGWNELVIEDYEFKGGHHIKMDVYLVQERADNQMIKRKPIIYLYTDEPLAATVKIDPKGEFTFTYPTYQDQWQVEIDAQNQMTVDGKSYPYLFWEAKSPSLNYTFTQNAIDGILIESDKAVDFLEASLNDLGFNQTEKTDFITYWGPILQQDKFAFIQFLIDDNYQSQVAELQVEPKPDNVRRVFILCSSLANDEIGVEVNPQSFSSFNREGFTIVEWGGSTIDFNNIGH